MVLMEQRSSKMPRPKTVDYQLIDPERYCQLAISSRPLERCDDADSGLRMLFDLSTGDRYAVEDSRLIRYLANRV